MKKNKIPFPLIITQKLFPVVATVFPWLADKWFQRLFFTPIRYPTPEKEIEAAQKAEKFRVHVGEKEIQCYVWGSGPTVLVVHGWAGRGTQFRKFIEYFNNAGFRIIAIDGPAHGKSEGTTTDIMEFSNVLQTIYEQQKAIAIIAHSFGGVASLYAIMQGMPNKIQINIASPTIGDEIIKTYLRAIQAPSKTGEHFKQYIIKKTGKPFDEFSALHLIEYTPPDTQLLLVHDINDEEVSIHHAYELRKKFPQAHLMETSKLGHNRILKDEEVINRCVAFIRAAYNNKM